MSYEVRVIDVGLGETLLAGRVLGERRHREVLRPASEALAAYECAVLVMSFSRVEFVTSSFWKATWLRLQEQSGLPPTMVTNLSEDALAEFSVFLQAHRLPGLVACDWSAEGVGLARLHGHIEPQSLRALGALIAAPGSTAPELASASAERLTPTAWTNRLQELHRNGLAFRTKMGRAWKFTAVASRIEVHNG